MLETKNVCYWSTLWVCDWIGTFMLVFKRQHMPEHRSSRNDSNQAMPCYLWTTCFMLIHISFACALLAVLQTN